MSEEGREERTAGVVGGKMGVGAVREVDSQVERRQMGAKRKLETSTTDCINRSEPLQVCCSAPQYYDSIDSSYC